jgi:hypothetical protein
MPIEGPEAEKAMEATKAAREAKKEALRGGTGASGPLFQLPGSENKES